MTADEIKTKLGIDDAKITPSETGGYWHISIEREHGGQRYTYSTPIENDPSDAALGLQASIINQWWSDTLEPIEP